MTPEGAKAYDDLVTKKDKREQWQSVLTTAGLAALPVRGRVIHGSSCWAAGGGVSSLAGIAPELTAPSLPVTSQPPNRPGRHSGLEAAGGIGTLGRWWCRNAWGFEALSLWQCCSS